MSQYQQAMGCHNWDKQQFRQSRNRTQWRVLRLNSVLGLKLGLMCQACNLMSFLGRTVNKFEWFLTPSCVAVPP